MRMLCSCIYMKVAEQLCTKSVFRKHTFYCSLNHCQWFALEQLFWSSETLTTRIPCVTNVHFVCQLLACQFHLLCIDHNDIVTAIYVRSVVGLVLASENHSDSGSEPTENLISSINHNPFFHNGLRVCRHCFVTLIIHCLLVFG